MAIRSVLHRRSAGFSATFYKLMYRGQYFQPLLATLLHASTRLGYAGAYGDTSYRS